MSLHSESELDVFHHNKGIVFPLIATTRSGRMCFCLDKLAKKRFSWFSRLGEFLRGMFHNIFISLLSGGVGCAITYLMWIR